MNIFVLFFLLLILLLLEVELTYEQPVNAMSQCQSGIREDNTNYIHCARRNLLEIPEFNRNNLIYDELVLSDNLITRLNDNSFSRIKVKKIYLNNNPIIEVTNKSFIRLANHLEELWLDSSMEQDDAIQGIPFAIKYYLRNLQILRLKFINIPRLSNYDFEKLQRLQVLSLQSCSIKTIDSLTFKSLINLNELYLDSNQLEQIPIDALLELKSLRILSLAQNQIKTININSFGYNYGNYLSNLLQLDLSYNGLKTVDKYSFNYLNSTLEILLLQNNELNVYNLHFIKSLYKLKELNLDFNTINTLNAKPALSSMIPSFVDINEGYLFINSKMLQYLSLQGNTINFDEQIDYNDYIADHVDSTSSIFYGLNTLQRLNLARNSIKQINKNLFKPLKSLKSLILDRNLIENLNESYVFNGLEANLVNISLQNMKITNRHLISLRKLNNIERIRLGFNEIEMLDIRLFVNISKNLTILDLQNNKIRKIKSIKRNDEQIESNLVELDLTNNKLCNINNLNLKQLKKLKYLSLTQNPLYCDCMMQELYKWLYEKYDREFLQFIQWSCVNGPFSVKNKKFIHLSPSEFKCNDNANKTRALMCSQNDDDDVDVDDTTTTVTTTITVSSTANQTTIVNEALKYGNIENEEHNIPRISDINIQNYLNKLLIIWKIDSNDNEFINGFRITVDDLNRKLLLKSAILDKQKRSFYINDLNLEDSNQRKYSICISILHMKGYDKYCRDLTINNENNNNNNNETLDNYTQMNATISANSALSVTNGSNKLLMIILVALICFIVLIIVCFYLIQIKCKSNKEQNEKIYTFNKPISSTSAVVSGSSTANTTTSTPKTVHSNELCDCGLFNFFKNHYKSSNGDTSTVSSTLSSVNNNNNNINNNSTTTASTNFTSAGKTIMDMQPNALLLPPSENIFNDLTNTNWIQAANIAHSTHQKSLNIPLLTTVNQCSSSSSSSSPHAPITSSSCSSYNYFNTNHNNSKNYYKVSNAAIPSEHPLLQQEHVYCEIPGTLNQNTIGIYNRQLNGYFQTLNNPDRQQQSAILIFEPTLSTSSTSNLIPVYHRNHQQQQQQHQQQLQQVPHHLHHQHQQSTLQFLNNQQFNVSII